MATSLPVVPASPSIWSDVKTTLRSLFGATVAVARTTEKAVGLIETEIDNLSALQLIRLDLTHAERAVQRVALDAALPSA